MNDMGIIFLKRKHEKSFSILESEWKDVRFGVWHTDRKVFSSCLHLIKLPIYYSCFNYCEEWGVRLHEYPNSPQIFPSPSGCHSSIRFRSPPIHSHIVNKTHMNAAGENEKKLIMYFHCKYISK